MLSDSTGLPYSSLFVIHITCFLKTLSMAKLREKGKPKSLQLSVYTADITQNGGKVAQEIIGVNVIIPMRQAQRLIVWENWLVLFSSSIYDQANASGLAPNL